MKGRVYTIYGIYLLHGFLRFCFEHGRIMKSDFTRSKKIIFKDEKIQHPEHRGRNFGHLTEALGLITKKDDTYYLTERGKKYVRNMSERNIWVVTDTQAEILREWVFSDPMRNRVVFPIVKMAELIYQGLKGDRLKHAFRDEINKTEDWLSKETIDGFSSFVIHYLMEMKILDEQEEITAVGENYLKSLDIQQGLILDVDVKLNQEYAIEEIENIFHTSFGRRIKGITLRKWEDRIPYIILFSRERGPYTDRIEEDILYFDGEGLNQDQKLTPANRALIESNKTERIIFGFRQEKPRGKWRYLGILKVVDYKYILKRGFKTYEFKLQIEEIEKPEEFSPESKDIIDTSYQEEPQLTDNAAAITTTMQKKQRTAAFKTKIKKYYDDSCAICSKKRYTAAGYPEVVAAHIYPKEKNGSDDLRNGVALCKLHHWAFDSGLLAITDDLHIIVRDDIKSDDNYEEIYQYENEQINLPTPKRFKPHPIFLKEHRKIHGFD